MFHLVSPRFARSLVDGFCFWCVLVGGCFVGFCLFLNLPGELAGCVNHLARATDRTKVSAEVIQLAAHEEDPAPEQAMSGDASDSDGSESASDSEQNDPPSSLVADAEQYELMQIAYAAVGKDLEASATPDGWLRCYRSCSWAVLA